MEERWAAQIVRRRVHLGRSTRTCDGTCQLEPLLDFAADLKPENFLLKTRDGIIDKDNLRAVDFGLSTFFQDGQVAKEVVGCVPCPAP